MCNNENCKCPKPCDHSGNCKCIGGESLASLNTKMNEAKHLAQINFNKILDAIKEIPADNPKAFEVIDLPVIAEMLEVTVGGGRVCVGQLDTGGKVHYFENDTFKGVYCYETAIFEIKPSETGTGIDFLAEAIIFEELATPSGKPALFIAVMEEEFSGGFFDELASSKNN